MAHLIQVDGGGGGQRFRSTTTQKVNMHTEQLWSRKSIGMTAETDPRDANINNTHNYSGLLTAAEHKAQREVASAKEDKREAAEKILAAEKLAKDPREIARVAALAKVADDAAAIEAEAAR